MQTDVSDFIGAVRPVSKIKQKIDTNKPNSNHNNSQSELLTMHSMDHSKNVKN